MTSKRQKVINRLKRRAKTAYYAAQEGCDMDCGIGLADEIRGTDTRAAAAQYENILSRLARIDPDFPKEMMR